MTTPAKPESFMSLIEDITPEIHANLRRAVELGRWPGGERLSAEQVELCLQALILYEARHLPESERSGYVGRGCKKTASCGHPPGHEYDL